jgi:hypothetical protein
MGMLSAMGGNSVQAAKKRDLPMPEAAWNGLNCERLLWVRAEPL